MSLVNKSTLNLNDSLRAPLYKILMLVDEYYQYHLHKRSQEAIEYYRDRGFSEDIIKKFSLGYSPKGYSQLVSQAKNIRWRDQVEQTIGYKMSDDELTDTIHILLELAGVTKSNENGSYDRFRDRVIFPIKNHAGKTVSFGGRKFRSDTNGPKYLNGSDSPLFRKNKVIFGLNHLSINTKYEEILVTEGYMDVASLHQFGFTNSVASMGTAFSEDQIEDLYKYTDTLHFCFDGDEAGRKAASRAAKNSRALLKPGRAVYISFLEEGEDPDSILRSGHDIESGQEAFMSALEAKTSIENFLLQHALKELKLQWGDNDRLVMAHLLNDVLHMPDGSDVANRIKQFVAIQSHEKSIEYDNYRITDLVHSFPPP
ncbi:toprim domain-containing protein [Vibrio sp. 10N.261.46.E12]|uniref:DNA primase n=2 Tax=Vibrio TaxID=662 RepID=UPI0009787694|nr:MULTISPECIES: toprim domain-containing protein [unclassified Vibrio]OMO33113.1 hypothetical protein BH584_15400 [Vibrio sp. 10N.261.45.E1]PMJ34036.1 hypothetical protein BCU27_24845 [Vibrio sp. 10N.286.45.B6]PML84288.1 hypothetical protein BCT66_17840 [Vibrio sp. 10N.261.49.E11]PMM90295.1 hypothetical protein BCT46_23645 [Vibrio sp. 10N.261.46.E8]PMN47525.1 hypothetical protein BCT32_09450 [Vibrio sp. 10N.261.45.E11]